MEEEIEVLRQIDWIEYGQTVLHPFAVLLVAIMAIVLLNSRSTFFLIPFLVIAAFITHMQRFVIFSLDFSMLRILMVTGILRVSLRNDTHKFEWEKMDSLIIAYIIVLSIAYVALRQNSSAIINRLGVGFETLLAFFLIRMYLNSIIQIRYFIKALSYVFILVAIFMTIEHLTHHNLFSVFGGVNSVTRIREGRLRAQGAFSHSIMAGTFGAAFMPLFWGLKAIGNRKEKQLAVAGIISSFVITWASSSSGPIITLMASSFAIIVWKGRRFLRYLILGSVYMIIILHIVMKAPVWHLISRIDIVGGSTGYHRYFLIDQTINRFSEWALLGVKTTGHWGWGLNDVTNMFIGQAVKGGVMTLILFLLIVHNGFLSVKRAIEEVPIDDKVQKLFWSWGAVLFAHCVSFFGVSYFGQMYFFWTLTLGILASLPVIAKNNDITIGNENTL
ncbi:hypothetical protein [Marispirochaeta sp.]|uniref:hypothetical protein n=1 Tax=Marispirochaeta sp. TaxID=2038653 RepID=UPI0029C8FF0C|nr:hypothetical protein [Marispirochaeta sp.]